MTLLGNLRKSYKIAVKCKNCGELSEIQIPKGVTIDSFLESEKSLCPSCGNNTLEKYTYPKMPKSNEPNIPQQPRPRVTPIFDLPVKRDDNKKR